MNFEEYWDSCTASERDQFQRTVRRLLKTTFIVRDKDEISKSAYFFVSKRQEMFTEYLKYIGFDVALDRDNGVVMLRNAADSAEFGRIQSNRVALKKIDSIILCSLWTIYAGKMRDGLVKNVMVSVAELRFELEKFGVREQVNRKVLESSLKLFSKFNLLKIHGAVGEPDCMIQLYPSMQFALDTEAFRKFVKSAAERMNENREEISWVMSSEESLEDDGADPDTDSEESDPEDEFSENESEEERP